MADVTTGLPALPKHLDKQKIEEAANGPLPPDREIDISFFSHKSRKSTRLVSNDSEGGAVRARREWLDFDLIEPIYITAIKISATGYEDYHEMEISLTDALSGEEITEKRRYSGEGFSFEPKRFVKGFGLRPDDSWSPTKSQYISKIFVRGIEQRSFFEVLQIYENLSREKSKIEDYLSEYFEKAKNSEQDIAVNEAKLAELLTELDDKSKQILELDRRLSRLSADRDELNKRIERGVSIEKERNERIQAIEINIGNLNTKRKDINSSIADEEIRLKNLKDNIDLFPTEISEYVGLGTRNIRLYAWLSLIPLGIIGFVTYRLFSNAERLLNFDLTGSTYDILEYLLSRSPYVIVSATILGISFSLVRGLFSEIININRRRQELFKVSIIASDVSFASQRGIRLGQEQLYDLRTQTKMELLKEHLKMNMAEDYTYSPGRVFSMKIKSLYSKNDSQQSGESEGDEK